MSHPLALIAALMLCFTMPGTCEAAETKIAVVDMLTLINKHPDIAPLRQKLEDAEKKARAFIKKRKEQAEKLRQRILEAPAGSDLRANLEKSFERQAWLDDYEYKSQLRDAHRLYVRELESIYAAVRSLVTRYARTNGIQLVLQTAGNEKINAVDRNDFVLKTALRSVIFADVPLDITAKIEAMFEKK